MATLEQLEAALIKADAAGNADDARVFAAEIRKMRAAPTEPTEKPYQPTMTESALGLEKGGALANIAQTSRNVGLGALRGAGSIGATLLAPIDAMTGRTDRRQSMTDATQTLGADPNSAGYQVGKIGAEVAGTLGAGGAVANTLARVPGVATAAPNLLNAIRTGGALGGNLATRTAGGAVTGGVAAGMIDPDQASAGAVLGGAIPGVTRVAGMAGNKLGSILRGGKQSPELAEAVRSAREAGYVIPPSQAKPTLGNRALEGLAGKLTTAQNASAKNQAVTNRLASEALGLPSDVKITPDVLKQVRDTAGSAYDAIGSIGTVTPGKNYTSALDEIAAPFKQAAKGFPNAKASPVLDLVDSLRSPSFDAPSAVAKIRELRTAADDAFRTGNTDVARASKAAAKALEDALEEQLKQSGATGLLEQYRNARKLIAKSYTVEKALNPASGTVDARKLAAELKKGKPLTDELRKAAAFAQSFPKAAQAVEGMGSLPQTSPLDWALSGGASMATGNPLYMAGLAARPAARSLVLSGPVQNNLIQGNPLIRAPQDLSLLYRAAPALAANR